VNVDTFLPHWLEILVFMHTCSRGALHDFQGVVTCCKRRIFNVQNKLSAPRLPEPNTPLDCHVVDRLCLWSQDNIAHCNFSSGDLNGCRFKSFVSNGGCLYNKLAVRGVLNTI